MNEMDIFGGKEKEVRKEEEEGYGTFRIDYGQSGITTKYNLFYRWTKYLVVVGHDTELAIITPLDDKSYRQLITIDGYSKEEIIIGLRKVSDGEFVRTDMFDQYYKELDEKAISIIGQTYHGTNKVRAVMDSLAKVHGIEYTDNFELMDKLYSKLEEIQNMKYCADIVESIAGLIGIKEKKDEALMIRVAVELSNLEQDYITGDSLKLFGELLAEKLGVEYRGGDIDSKIKTFWAINSALRKVESGFKE